MHNKKYTRLLSIILTVAMISTEIPVTSYAAGISEGQVNEVVQENLDDIGSDEGVAVYQETSANEIIDVESADEESYEDSEGNSAPETEEGTSDVVEESTDTEEDTADTNEDIFVIDEDTTDAEEDTTETEVDEQILGEDTTETESESEVEAESVDGAFEYKNIKWLQSKITNGITLSDDESEIKSINIQDSKGLIYLSQLSPELYDDAEITLSQTSSTNYFDITSNSPIKEEGEDGSSVSYFFQPMGSKEHPFKGSINYNNYKIVETTPLFNYLGSATITGNDGVSFTLAKYTYLGTEEVSPMLANHYVSTDDEGATKEYSIKLEKYNGLQYEPKFDGVIGEIAENAKLTLNIINEKEADIEGNENAGFICNTLGTESILKVNLSSPIKNNVTAETGSAGGLIGYVKTGATVVVNGDYTYQGTVTGNVNAGGLIGTLETGASVTVNGNAIVSGSINATAGNAGGLVGDVENTSSIVVTGTVSTGENGSLSVTADAVAGGLIGNMGSKSSLSIKGNTTLDNTLTVSGATAGGLIGYGEDVNISDTHVTIGGESLDHAPTVSGKEGSENAIGGLIGTYKTTGLENTFAAYSGADDSSIQVKSVKLLNTNGKGDTLYAGGLFGILDLCGDFSVSSVNINSSMSGVANYGGLAGQITTSSTNTGKLQQFTISGGQDNSNGNTIATANDSKSDLASYGGIAAYTDNVYVKVEGVTNVTATECGSMKSAGHYFGGAVARLVGGAVLDLSDGANYSLTASGIIYGGGIAGYTGQGSAVRLEGTTDLSNISFTEQYSTYYKQSYGAEVGNNFGGQIVGAQNSSLIYATKSWTLKRPTEGKPIDDIGNYGSVIRLGKNMGRGSGNLGAGTGLDEDLITIDTDTRKIQLKTELKAEISGNTINIANENQFALLAIAEQTKGYFPIYNQGKDTFILKDGVINVINFTRNIDLQSTGITGLQRDCYLDDWAFPGSVKDVNVNGKNNTITLAAGEVFGLRDGNVISDNTASGSGQIHGHAQVGLFSQANGAFKDITFAGSINLWEREGTTKEVGAATAVNTWTTSYNNVTTNVTINSLGRSGGYSHIGGLIGRKNNDALTIANCVGNAIINAENSNNVAYGGILGYFTGEGTISVDTLSLTGSITDKNISDARVGGFVAVVDMSADLTMTLNNVSVEGQKIETDASATAGGLLGYDWNNTKVTFKGAENTADGAFGVKVVGDSEVKVTGNASNGALVYCATGYWQINSIDLEKLAVTSGNGDLGLLICKSIFRDGGTNLFLYLEETSHGAYQIGNEVSVTNAGGNFDEWAVYTADSADKIVGNECSVISIATAAGNRVAGLRAGVDLADDQCTSYQNRTAYGKKAAANPNARYYYDLDVIRAKLAQSGSDNKIDSAEELMLWSVYQYTLYNTWTNPEYSQTNISTYFAKADVTSATIDGDGKNIDLTGYSYYPVQVKTSTTVTNINLTFANKEIERAEAGGSLDSLNRKTGGTSTEHTQHYLMHYGLFANVSGGVTLSASNVSFGGTVGYSEGTSGALVCGIAQGESSTRILNIKLSSITLDGVKLYDGNDKFDSNGFAVTDKYSALLINKIGNYSTLEVERRSDEGAFGIKTTDKYSNTEHNTTYYAAGSLIGTVGSASGTYIHMNFLGTMALDGRDTSNTVKTYDERYGTCHSVFTRATLLESFQYPTSETSSGGFYNFNKDDVATYGKEISNTDSGRNQENQYWYYDDKTENGYVKDTTTGADAKDDDDGKTGGFLTGYLRYVQAVENKSGNWELDINQKQVAFDEGCGTYGHPYLVNSADQLIAIMDILDTATFKPGFVIQVNSKVLNDSKGDSDYHNTTSTNDKLLYFDGTNWSIAQKDGDSYKAGTTNETVDKSKLLKYIRNAYYMITTDISLDVSSFRGLGSHELTDSDNTGGAFSGVIVGQKNTETNQYPTITLHGTTERDNFGGLVRYSQGSVIKDLNIKYEKTDKNTLTINDNGNTCILETQPFFGGVIGWAFGGDSIIDNVNVTYAENYIQVKNVVTPAGGYVGIVGGDTSYGGGVVFRNMKDNICDFYIGSNLSNSDTSKEKYYWNPFVGRVYDGYVCYDSVNSSETNKSKNLVYLQNTDKNYTIPNLMSEDKLSVNKWSSNGSSDPATVTVGSAEQLWVLSAIVSSGAGGANDSGDYTNVCNAYYKGKVRSGQYDSIGIATAKPDYLEYDEKKWGGIDDKSDKNFKVPYLIRNYTNSIKGNSGKTEYPMIRVTGESSLFELSITKNCDMSEYKNGFRGIGPVYPTGGSNYIITTSGPIDAKTKRKIISMSEVSGPSADAVKITMQRTLNVPNNNESWTCATLGLFTYLYVYTDLAISNIKVGGKLEVNNDVAGTNTDYLLGGIAGGIVKSDNTKSSTLTFDNVHIENLKITSASSPEKLWGRHAGGFLGAAYFVKECAFNNCGYDTLTIQNTRWTAGGFVGNVMMPVKVMGKTVIKNGVFDQNVNLTDAGVSSGYVSGNWYAIGGLFGYNEYAVNINQENQETDTLQAENINMSGWVTGGLVGASVAETQISNVKLDGYSAVGLSTIASASGGIIGLYSTKISIAKTAKLLLDNISVSNAHILLPKAEKNPSNIGSSAGGIVGSSRMTSKSRELIIKTKCQVSDSTIVSYGSSGGIIGDSGNLLSGSSISNVVVSDCKIVSSRYDTDWSGVGGLVGMTSSAIKGYNLYSKDNMVGYLLENNTLWSSNDYSKLKTTTTVGEVTVDVLDPAQITKNNVGLISNAPSYCSYATYRSENDKTSVAEKSRVGIWIGNTGDDNQDIQLVAVRRSGDYTAVHNFGREANSANTRVIYNDYTGIVDKKMNATTENNTLSTTDTTWPYVAENPEHTFITDKGDYERYGDGMRFTSKSDTDDTEIPIAEKIAKDTAQIAENPIGYSNIGYKYFYDACKEDFVDNNNKWKYEENFASFLESEEIQDMTNITDFPVLVVEDSSTINEQIKKTLKLLTNSNYIDTAVADITKVECNVLSLNDDGKFTVGESKVRTVDLAASNASIWYDTDNKVFRARNTVAFDSGKKQFTLVTVTLGSDPNDAAKEFKVSLAVYVQKNIYFKFYASGISGTTYETKSYLDNNSAVMTNYGDSFTELLSFEFERTNDEWVQALNAGENLCTTYDKSVWLGDRELPDGTRFILVDPQQSGTTAYYATSKNLTETNKLSFSAFEGWKDVTISDYLKAKATAVDVSAEGTKFVQVKDNAEATVKCGEEYYRLATSEELADTNRQKYTISLGNTGEVKYHYYLTIVTPESESGSMINNLITYEDTWLTCNTAGGIRAKNHNGDGNVTEKVFARKGNENRYIIYNFFSQTISATSSNPGSLTIDEVLKTATLTHTIESTINLDEKNANTFRSYATDNTKLFQRYDMSLKDVDSPTESPAAIAAGTRYEISYVIEATDANGNVKKIPVPGYTGTIATDCTTYSFPYASKDTLDSIIGYFKDEGYNSITMKATLNLIYDEETLYKQFKVKESSSDKNDFGLRYSFTSKLSMNENTIAATSVKAQNSVGTLFYRSSYELAKLSYNAIDGVATNERSGDISKLGINAFSSKEYQELLSNPSEISSMAGYDVTAMKNRTDGAKLHCVFTLYCKNENGEYQQIDNIGDYLTAPKIREETATVSDSSYVLNFDLTNDEKKTYPTVPITFTVDYAVNTADKLPSGASYANYKVVLTVDMLTENGTSLDMEAEDYIIYTNAKVNPAIQPKSQQ